MVKKVSSASEYRSTVASGIVVVDFFAEWCSPCRRIAPLIDQLSTENPSVVFIKVDVDELEEIAGEENVSAMPTFVFYKNGARVKEVVGASFENVKSVLASLL